MLSRWALGLAGAVSGLVAAAPGGAEVVVQVSAPRSAVELVCYANADLTLVRETRTVELGKGATEVVLAWPGTAVDVSSVSLTAPEGVKVSPTSQPPLKGDQLVCRLEAEEAGAREVQVTYFTSGIEWRPYYRLAVNEGTGIAELEGLVSLRNRSGQAFDGARVRLAAGDLPLTANLAEAAWKALPAYSQEAKGAPPSAGSGLSERTLYDLGILPRLALGDSYAAAFLPKAAARGRIVFRLHTARHGEGVHKLLAFDNSPEAGLGRAPLLRAEAQILEVSAGGPLPRGKVTVPYTPIGEECEIDLGVSGDVRAERRVMERRRTNFEFDRFGAVEGYDDREDIEVEFSNWSPREAEIEYTDTVPGVWDVASDEAFAEEGLNEVVFSFSLAPQQTKVLDYRLLHRQGRRVRLGPVRPK